MTLVDQRILIPAPMQSVWQIIADHRQLPKWRNDVASVSVLTTEPSRVGTRRRISRKNGKRDLIEEMVVWYEGIGYEYTLIEGSDYRSYRSRIRLQAAADGTIVQWVISYELGGLLRRIIGGRRRKKKLEAMTIDSLRQLRRYVESTGARLDDTYRLKNSIQAAPDVQARAQYGAKLIAQEESSRQVAAIQADQVSSAEGSPRIVEPPRRIDDTPSVPYATPPSFLKEALQTSELTLPTGVKPVLTEPTQDTQPVSSAEVTDDTTPKPVVKIEEPPIPPDSTQPRPAIILDDADELKDSKQTSELSDSAARQQVMEMKPITSDELDDELEVSNPDLPPLTPKRDTGEVSIWEVFGLRRPSDELSQIITELEQGDTAESSEDVSTEEVTNRTPVPMDIQQTSLPEVSDKSEASAELKTKPKMPLDEWLMADEPPLPESSTESMKNIVRIEQKPKIGLRRLQRQREEAVRRRNRRGKRSE